MKHENATREQHYQAVLKNKQTNKQNNAVKYFFLKLRQNTEEYSL